MIWLALAWLANIAFSIGMTRGRKRSSVGLPLAFVFSTTFLYIGFIAYLNPEYSHDRFGGSLYLLGYDFDRQTVLLGTAATVLALTFFNVGAFACRRLHRSPRLFAGRGQLVLTRSFRNRILLGLSVFAIAGFFLAPLNLPIPMFDALMQVGRNAAVIVVCLGLSLSILVDGKSSNARWLAIGALIPASYLVLYGFISYGFIVVCCLFGFYLSQISSRKSSAWLFTAASVISSYFLLSTFIAWMTFRDSLRELIWAGAPLGERVQAVANAIMSIRLLSWMDFESLDLITMRLNQYVFVGKAIELHSISPDLRLWGETIWVSAFAWVPRFLWPGKPQMNNTQFMRDHTGIDFSDSAAFGNGPVMEYYVNFGWIGIAIGFLILGFVVASIDQRAAQSLRSGRLLNFAKWFAVGLPFIAPLTSLFFMINTAIVSFAVFHVLQWIVGRTPWQIRASGLSERV